MYSSSVTQLSQFGANFYHEPSLTNLAEVIFHAVVGQECLATVQQEVGQGIMKLPILSPPHRQLEDICRVNI